MNIHTREFTVNGQSVTMAHDRDNGRRYYVKKDQPLFEVFGVNCYKVTDTENYVFLLDTFDNALVLFTDVEKPDTIVKELKAIFWIM